MLLNRIRNIPAEIEGTCLLASVCIECGEEGKILFDDGDKLFLSSLRMHPASGWPQFANRDGEHGSAQGQI